MLSQLAHLALSEGRTADARTACDAVREILEDLPDEARPFITAGLGWRAVADGDASGLALMEESVSSAKVRGEKYDLSYMLAILGAGRLATNNRVGAHPAYEEALQLAEEGGNPWDRANALEGLAACLVLCGEDSGETARLLLKAEALRKEIGGVRPPAYEWIANIARRSARPGLDSA